MHLYVCAKLLRRHRGGKIFVFSLTEPELPKGKPLQKRIVRAKLLSLGCNICFASTFCRPATAARRGEGGFFPRTSHESKDGTLRFDFELQIMLTDQGTTDRGCFPIDMSGTPRSEVSALLRTLIFENEFKDGVLILDFATRTPAAHKNGAELRTLLSYV